jgi:thiol-disulfide isomerase/thioredoxin
MKLLRFSLLIMVAVLLAACGDSNKFKIHGTVANNATLNLRVVYFGDDNINNVLTAARDGVFEFEGNAPRGQLLEVLDNDYRVLARIYVQNGEEVKLKIDPQNPLQYTASGTAVNEAWTQWLADNAKTLNTRNAAAINDAVARYVKAHTDDVLSTLLLLTTYDTNVNPAQGQKLMASIKVDARPTYLVEGWVANLARAGEKMAKTKVMPITYVNMKDTLETYSPKKQNYTLLTFTNDNCGRRDSIIDKLREIAKKYPNRKRLAIVDFSLENDTFTWRRSVRADSIAWTAAWGGGSVAGAGIERLGITALPFFIVADSAGTQLYRGTSITAAQAAITKKLK